MKYGFRRIKGVPKKKGCRGVNDSDSARNIYSQENFFGRHIYDIYSLVLIASFILYFKNKKKEGKSKNLILFYNYPYF